jgi:anthranilate phosphoribosyltransferase
MSTQPPPPPPVSIADLLKRLASPTAHPHVSPSEISLAFSRIFENRLSSAQLAAFLTLLHSTSLDREPPIIAACAQAMRDAALPISRPQLKSVIGKRKRELSQGSYRGGLCDIVGTGGDSHSTFNISTTSSIIASPLLMMAKHGNRAQTSKSGSADVLNCITPTPPKLEAVSSTSLPKVYETSNYAFLFAPNFHSGMRHAATVRKELGLRTIFNIMGPLANPVEWALEARLVGVATKELGPPYVEALRLSGARKALVVCGHEQLDEISCAGGTDIWMLDEIPNPEYMENATKGEDDETSDDDAIPRYTSQLSTFTLRPSDFGLPVHPLSGVGGGQGPEENAKILMAILRNELPPDHPILHFVLMNVAALLVVAGICESDEIDVIRERGPGNGRWKEGVRRARECITSGKALAQLEAFIKATNELGNA